VYNLYDFVVRDAQFPTQQTENMCSIQYITVLREMHVVQHGDT